MGAWCTARFDNDTEKEKKMRHSKRGQCKYCHFVTPTTICAYKSIVAGDPMYSFQSNETEQCVLRFFRFALGAQRIPHTWERPKRNLSANKSTSGQIERECSVRIGIDVVIRDHDRPVTEWPVHKHFENDKVCALWWMEFYNSILPFVWNVKTILCAEDRKNR